MALALRRPYAVARQRRKWIQIGERRLLVGRLRPHLSVLVAYVDYARQLLDSIGVCIQRIAGDGEEPCVRGVSAAGLVYAGLQETVEAADGELSTFADERQYICCGGLLRSVSRARHIDLSYTGKLVTRHLNTN